MITLPKKKFYINIPENELKKLYEIDKLSSPKIANKYNCSKNTILSLMKKYGIRARTKKETSRMIVHPMKYKISKEDLECLYNKKKLSMKQIADIYKTQSSVIYNKIKKYGIKTRTLEEGIVLSIPRRSRNIASSIIKYKRRNFSEDSVEKSYLIGFRKGDLYVRKNKYGKTIFVQCKSTKKDQIDLIRNLFIRYGNVKISQPYKDGGRQVSCYLNLSFSFLLDNRDKIDEWILKDKDNFVAFLGGYVDAEGHFGIDRNFGEFSVSSYDRNIINNIYGKLLELGIEGQYPKISQKKGYIDKRGFRNNSDMWKLKIVRKNELFKFITLIENYIKHQKRYNDMLNVKSNLIERGVTNI